MTRYIINICILMLFLGCADQHIPSTNSSNFQEYVNDNKISMKIDGTIIKDKSFKLQIPLGLSNKHNIIDGSFLQLLDYKNDKKIIILYIPNGEMSPSAKALNMHYDEFVAFCKKEGILSSFEEISLNKHRNFGIYKPNESKFYAIYLNIKASDAVVFNYSISSMQL